jgi:ATP-dependent RNA helicase DDX35
VDEAHERSLSSDVLLGLLKKILRKRRDLRVIVSSATIQAEDFLAFFSRSDTPKDTSTRIPADKMGRIINIEGRMFPVDIHYLEKPTEDYITQAVETVFDIHTKEEEGDILVFLTGRNEIDQVIDMINERAADHKIRDPGIQVMPLYAGLSTEQQMYVFEPAEDNMRKVIVATNIAEASVTIDGIRFVVDCGFVKLRAYDPSTSIEILSTTPTSKASANQRAGRAGRTKPGKCYRLYPENVYRKMDESTPPEIQRSNLTSMILQLKALGIENIARFDFLTSPPSELIIRAMEILYSLGALDDYAKLTRPLGLRMAEISVEPMMAKVLLAAPGFQCMSEMLSIAAMTSLQGSLWVEHEDGKKALDLAKRKFAVEEGDHIALLNIYTLFVSKGKKDAKWCHNNHLNYKSMSKAVSVRNQLKRYLERFGHDMSESLAGPTESTPDLAVRIQKCLVSGYFSHAAKMQPDGCFKSVNGATLWAHPTSTMINRSADWVIFHDLMETGGKIYIREITKIERAWLVELAPQFYQTETAQRR